MANSKISALPSASTPLAGTEVLPIVQGGITEQVSVADLTAGRSVAASTVVVSGNNTGITTGDPLNIVRFTDTDTTAAAGQPMGRIEWVSSDAGFEGIKGYIQVEATDGSPDGDMYFATQHNTGAGLAKRLKLTYDGDVTALTGNFVVGTSGKGVDFSATAGTGTSELLADYEEGTWTPAIRGSGTAGTYQMVTNYGFYTKVGNQVTIVCAITLAAVVTGGGTGDLQITGLPFSKKLNSAASGGSVQGIFTTIPMVMSFGTRGSTSVLYVYNTLNNAIQVSEATANKQIDFTYTYLV
jgi:hypothetical protein